MPQKTITKHNSSPAARSVAEASVSSSSSNELFSDVSQLHVSNCPTACPRAAWLARLLLEIGGPGASGGS